MEAVSWFEALNQQINGSGENMVVVYIFLSGTVNWLCGVLVEKNTEHLHLGADSGLLVSSCTVIRNLL